MVATAPSTTAAAIRTALALADTPMATGTDIPTAVSASVWALASEGTVVDTTAEVAIAAAVSATGDSGARSLLERASVIQSCETGPANQPGFCFARSTGQRPIQWCVRQVLQGSS